MFLVLGKIFAILLPFIAGFIVGRKTKKTKFSGDLKKNTTKNNKQYIKFFEYGDKVFWILAETYNQFWFETEIDIYKSRIIHDYNNICKNIDRLNILVNYVHDENNYISEDYHAMSLEDTLR